MNKDKSGNGSKELTDVCLEALLSLFFVDFFISGMQTAAWQKEH